MRIFFSIVCFVVCFSTQGFSANDDRLAEEIVRWKTFIQTKNSTSENSVGLRESSRPLIDRAENALKANRRNLALHIVAAIRTNLAAQQYVEEHQVTAATELTALEREWNQHRALLESPEQPSGFEQLPTSVRAIAETAFSEIKVYYDASLEYGKNTMPEYGFFYIGLSKGQLEFTRFLQNFQKPNSLEAPKLPGLKTQILALEDQLLAAYKPPVSIDQHPNFIRASGLIKQAHELYAAGFEFGALYRILYARQILSKITNAGKSIPPEEVVKQSKAVAGRLTDSKTDHSLGWMFVELANEEPHNGETARSVFEDILPIYFASLQASKEQPLKTTPAVTVTLVRWPYT